MKPKHILLSLLIAVLAACSYADDTPTGPGTPPPNPGGGGEDTGGNNYARTAAKRITHFIRTDGRE